MHEKDVEYRIVIITVSTSRYEKYGELRGVNSIGEFDESGKLIYESFKEYVIDYYLLPDDIIEIRKGSWTL